MLQVLAEDLAVLNQRLDLVDRIAMIHEQLCRQAPSIQRVAFAIYHQNCDLLCTHVSHPALPATQWFHEQQLATIPSLQYLAQARCSRVIDDLAAELSSESVHRRWLLSQGGSRPTRCLCSGVMVCSDSSFLTPWSSPPSSRSCWIGSR